MPAAMLSTLDKNPPVNSNIEPSINATSDLSNDGGSSKRGSISGVYILIFVTRDWHF